MPLVEERLANAWKYIASQKAEDDYTRNIFSYLPRRTGEHEITISLINDVQISKLREFEPYIRDLLARGFRRNDIDIIYKVSTEGVDESALMSDDEKLKKLEEQNSDFKYLFKALELEII